MSGVLIETWSNRRLTLFLSLLLLLQAAFFLLGGLVAPAPNSVNRILGTACIDNNNIEQRQHRQRAAKWFQPRASDPSKRCRSKSNLRDDTSTTTKLSGDQIVFAFQLPLPREGIELKMSRWFQSVLGILEPEIHYDRSYQLDEDARMRLEIRIGYRDRFDDEDDWKLLAGSNETRILHCDHSTKPNTDMPFDCAPLPLFELGSSHHDYYLLNIRLPLDDESGREVNHNIGRLDEMWLVEIHQTGGFTQVWLTVKTCTFPLLLFATIWFWRRVRGLPRRASLVEKSLLALGIGLTQLSAPIEWLTLRYDLPFFVLLSDLRQGVFCSLIMAFWVIFAGEHMMDGVERNTLHAHWKHLLAVALGCICLFVFDLCERGVQLANPFYTIWATETGNAVARFFLAVAALASLAYFLFFCYLTYRVFRNINLKRSALPSMSEPRRQFYQGLIFRFKFLMGCTVVCAAVTVISFIVGQYMESYWKWADDAPYLEYTSSFIIGVYGMWCLYVFALLILYSPNSKYYGAELLGQSQAEATLLTAGDDKLSDMGGDTEEIEFQQLATEASSLTAFAKKAAIE